MKASLGGKVVRASDHDDYGKVVIIDHSAEVKSYSTEYLYTLYAHLKKMEVDFNDTVVQGEKIGEVGDTGNSAGSGKEPHLHFEVIKNNVKVKWKATGRTNVGSGEYRVSPLAFLREQIFIKKDDVDEPLTAALKAAITPRVGERLRDELDYKVEFLKTYLASVKVRDLRRALGSWNIEVYHKGFYLGVLSKDNPLGNFAFQFSGAYNKYADTIVIDYKYVKEAAMQKVCWNLYTKQLEECSSAAEQMALGA